MIHDLDPLNAEEFRKYRVPNNQGVDQGANTNWLDEITRTGLAHQHTVTLSGGNSRSNYRATIDFKDATGWIFVLIVKNMGLVFLLIIQLKVVC